MTKKYKLSLFRYLIFFIFFCSLFFIKNDTVYARLSGGGDINIQGMDIIRVTDMQKSSERKIIDGSTAFDSDIGAFHYGQTEKMVKYMNQYKSMTHEGTISNQYNFLSYCTDVLKLKLGGEIIAYPDCMVIEEFVRKI